MTSEAKQGLYRDKLILAPMVRVGTLPMRLLALEYGADVVYTEELIDWKMLNSKRVENPIMGTIDYVDITDGSIVFQTNAEERGRVVLQLGTSDPERALRVGQMVQEDVMGIDINMGCPKEFSVKGGMGVALLYNPEKAKAILRRLVEGLHIPVTCKIRILETAEATIALVKEFEAIGISAIGIHGRTKVERPQHAVHMDVIRQVAESIDIPVICNGGSRNIDKYVNIIEFREQCGASSVMVARAAQQNVSVFRKAGTMPLDEVIVAYLKKSIKFLHQPTKTKYCVQGMLRELQETPRGRLFLDSQTLEQICEIWNLGGEYRKTYQNYVAKGFKDVRATSCKGQEQESDEPSTKKLKEDDSWENVVFIRTNFNNTNELPKSVIFTYALNKGKKLPIYETEQSQKLFRSKVRLDGQVYSTGYWEKNKKFAEQGAALAAMLALGLVSRESLLSSGGLIV